MCRESGTVDYNHDISGQKIHSLLFCCGMNITNLKQIGSAFGYIAINPLSLILKEGSVIMPFPQERIYTIADIYNLPEDTRAELIDG